MSSSLTRTQIIDAIERRFDSLSYVQALWEGGSAAFDRVDTYSDVDLQAIVDDDCVAETIEAADRALASLSPIVDRYELPQPTWHGHAQIFYTLADAPEFMLIDLAIMKAGSEERFLQPEVHGRARILFDKTGATETPPFDYEAHAAQLQRRVAQIAEGYARRQQYVRKEILRGSIINAMYFYPGMTLRPLVELLRIRYDPTRADWGQRYLDHYLPSEATERFERLNLIADLDDLAAKQADAAAWVAELIAELSTDG